MQLKCVHYIIGETKKEKKVTKQIWQVVLKKIN